MAADWWRSAQTVLFGCQSVALFTTYYNFDRI
jgi:hypothetical protein